MKGEAFVKMPRDLLESAAWRSLSLNSRKLIDFLMIQHTRHAGKKNGELLAPRRDLEQAGIPVNMITGAIEDAERVGVIDCKRGTGRQPSLYTMTWLPLSDGTDPSCRWRHCDAEATEIVAARKLAKARDQSAKPSPANALKTKDPEPIEPMQSEVANEPVATVQMEVPKDVTSLCANNDRHLPSHKARSDCANGGHKGGRKVRSPYRRSIPGARLGSVEAGTEHQQDGEVAVRGNGSDGGGDSTHAEQERERVMQTDRPDGPTCPWYVTNEHGYRMCGKPVVPGTEYCAEHTPRRVDDLIETANPGVEMLC
jgi:hypothetical protein